jgi:hypothetical protein
MLRCVLRLGEFGLKPPASNRAFSYHSGAGREEVLRASNLGAPHRHRRERRLRIAGAGQRARQIARLAPQPRALFFEQGIEQSQERAPVRVAVLVNPADATATETTLRDVPEAARVIGLQIHILNASTSREIAHSSTAAVPPTVLAIADEVIE